MTPPSATALSWAIAAWMTWRHNKDTDYIHTAQTLASRFLPPPMDAHISNSCSLGNGVDSKQSRVGIIGIKSTDLFNKIKWGKLEILNAESNVCRCLHWKLTPLTSKGSAVALATPCTSLLVVFEPLLTCGPAPSRCCRTAKASASLVPAAAD